MSRPLRVLIVGDLRYQSEFLLGVHQGAVLLNHWCGVMEVQSEVAAIARKFAEVQPDIAFMHMLAWSPGGPAHTAGLLQVCAEWRRRGTRVLMHDGDARVDTRYPRDLSAAVDLALCNHSADRSAWRVPCLRWPYFCFVQDAPVAPVDEFRCDLLFAGRQGPGLYAERTALISTLKSRMGDRFRVYPTPEVPHTLFRTPEVAASAAAVLGHARPETWTAGWKDVRYWVYPGAGGVLLHDDDTGPLVPGEHFLLYESGDVDSIIRAAEVAKERGQEIRERAFRHLQAHHSSVVRVSEALRGVGL